MKRDFTLYTYQDFLQTAINCGYYLTSFEEYLTIQEKPAKILILRHDVDSLPENSLATARLQHSLGVKGSYYFRMVPESFQPRYIEQIRDLGHEIGYHYEDLASSNGDMSVAIRSFEKNLETLRKFYPIRTMCMHGSPMSRWDNREIWKVYDYRNYGILAEPYFDLDFSRILYITDTGRQWNRTSVSVRDKVDSPFRYNFTSTFSLIQAFRNIDLPDVIMQNIHPQRWNDDLFGWSRELVVQNLKNQVKSYLIKYRQ
jgi:hypothetical protein